MRLFNVEHCYYDQIAKTQKSVFKKYYAKVESFLLLKYENHYLSKIVYPYLDLPQQTDFAAVFQQEQLAQ